MFLIDLDVKSNENVNNMRSKITLYLLSPLPLLAGNTRSNKVEVDSQPRCWVS
jgi:hypothetical protein